MYRNFDESHFVLPDCHSVSKWFLGTNFRYRNAFRDTKSRWKFINISIELPITFEFILESIRYRTAFLHRNFDEKALEILANTEAKMPFQSLIFDENPLGLSSNFSIIFEHLGGRDGRPTETNFRWKTVRKTTELT